MNTRFRSSIRQLRTEVLAWRTEHGNRIRDLERAPAHTHEAIPERLCDRLRAVEGVVLKQTVIASIVGAVATGVTLGFAWLTGLLEIGGKR